jgi:hypothetical protein
MKKISILLLLCTSFMFSHAQTKVEKHFDFSQKKFLLMNIQIADSIQIVTWNKNEVYLNASVNVNDNKDNDDYKFSFNDQGSSIEIHSKFDVSKEKKSKNNCCCNYESRITCVVYIPENADFSVETISGNIIIKGKTSEIKAHTISGYIDLAVAPESRADLKMSTISGTMYTDFELQEKQRNLRHVGGSSINTELNGGGGKRIDLKTISGDIFFRKA